MTDRKCPYCKKTKVKRNEKVVFTIECRYCGYPDVDGLLKRFEKEIA